MHMQSGGTGGVDEGGGNNLPEGTEDWIGGVRAF